jgi:hypothetical protein
MPVTMPATVLRSSITDPTALVCAMPARSRTTTTMRRAIRGHRILDVSTCTPRLHA